MSAELDTPAAVRRAAMDLLARREHGRAELGRKLLRRGAQSDCIESALDLLEQQGLLSEDRYLSSYIASGAAKGWGPLRIRDELQQRGVKTEAIALALENSEIDWDRCLRETWQRKFGCLPADARERARQGRFLAYRGFAVGAISRLLQGRMDPEA